jgi:hypothetical protein
MAALDFPNTPTNGDTFTSPNGGAVYTWDGAKWLTSSVASNTAGQNNVGRNLLHNPLFNIAQRGAGPFTTSVYGLDRWVSSTINDAINVTQVAMLDADRASIGDESARFACQRGVTGSATAGSVNSMLQCVEDVRRLAGKTVTVSFWAKAATGTSNLGVSIDQLLGTGGSPSTDVLGVGQAVVLSTTWTRYSLTFALGSLSGKTLGTNGDSRTALTFWFSATAAFATRAGSIGVQTATTGLWGVQLEIGSTATQLEKPDPADDLRRCQRFYQIGFLTLAGYNTAGGTLNYAVPFKVTMRAATTPTVSGATATNFGSTM